MQPSETPKETLSAAQHRRMAELLLAELSRDADDLEQRIMDERLAEPKEIRAVVAVLALNAARAQAHATLATIPPAATNG